VCTESVIRILRPNRMVVKYDQGCGYESQGQVKRG
jgi:hypothetical protein